MSWFEPFEVKRDLRYRDWIEGRRAAVAEMSDGTVGYIYVPNTGRDGQSDLVRQFHGQSHMPALVIDERWNGGGQIPKPFHRTSEPSRHQLLGTSRHS